MGCCAGDGDLSDIRAHLVDFYTKGSHRAFAIRYTKLPLSENAQKFANAPPSALLPLPTSGGPCGLQDEDCQTTPTSPEANPCFMTGQAGQHMQVGREAGFRCGLNERQHWRKRKLSIVAENHLKMYRVRSIGGLQSTKCCVTCDTCEKVTFNSPRYMLLRNCEIPATLGMRDCRSLMHPCH